MPTVTLSDHRTCKATLWGVDSGPYKTLPTEQCLNGTVARSALRRHASCTLSGMAAVG